MPQSEEIRFSLVIATRDEPDAIEELVTRAGEAFSTMSGAFEVIVVDDGSASGAWGRLVERRAERAWLKGIRLAGKFGRHPATLAGLAAARGEIVLTIDEELEARPEEIRLLASRVEEGWDVVFGARPHGKDGFIRGRIEPAVTGFLSRFTAGSPRNVSSFLAARRGVVEAALAHPVARPVTPFHIMLGGARRSSSVEVAEGSRGKGRSRRGIFGLARLSLDVLLGYTGLAEAALVVAAAAVPSGTLALWLLSWMFSAVHLSGPASVLALAGVVYAIASLSGLMFFVGEIALRAGSPGRPLYVIAERF